ARAPPDGPRDRVARAAGRNGGIGGLERGRPARPEGLGGAPARTDADHAADGRDRRPDRVLRRARRRRVAADPHVRPASLRGLGAALEPGPRRPRPVRPEQLLRLPLGLLAPAGRPPTALLPLPEDLAAGRLLRLRPVAEPARHRAHRARPLAGGRLAPGRLAADALLRPALRRSVLADAADEVALLGRAGRA